MTSSTNTQSIPPLRSQRDLCWKLRDEYFECLDNINNSNSDDKLFVDPVSVQNDENMQKLVKKFNCWKKKEEYEKSCITSWVSEDKIEETLIILMILLFINIYNFNLNLYII